MAIGTMVFIGLVAIALIAFVIIRRKKRHPKLEGTAVPIHDPDEIKQLKKSMAPSHSRKKMTNSQLMQMAQAEAGILPAPAPADFMLPLKEAEKKPAKIEAPVIKETPPPPAAMIVPPAVIPPMEKEEDRIQRLEAENKNLKEALEREIKGKKAAPAEAETPGPPVRQEEALAQDQLKQLIQREQEQFQELEKKFSAFKVEYEHQKSLAWTKEEVLQGQILHLREDNEKLQELKGKMETAEAELNGLRFYKKETEDTLRQLEKEVLEAKRSNQEVLPQLKEAQAQAAKAVQDLQLQKVNEEQQISNLTDKIMALQKNLESPAAPLLDEASKNIWEPLRVKNEELIKVNQQLSNELEKLKEYNVQVREKEKILQYELTKARAQSIGLEKICEDFKIHIERLSKVSP